MWARHPGNFHSAQLLAAALILSLIFMIFVSCSPYSDDDFYAGRPVSPEEISEIEAMIAAAEETAFRPETFADGSPKCYWTSGGTVWHIDPGCGRISASSPLSSGTVEEAAADGKTRECAVCGGKAAG